MLGVRVQRVAASKVAVLLDAPVRPIGDQRMGPPVCRKEKCAEQTDMVRFPRGDPRSSSVNWIFDTSVHQSCRMSMEGEGAGKQGSSR